MSRHDEVDLDDYTEMSNKTPAADEFKYIDKAGRLTHDGKISVYTFRGCCLVPDPDGSIESHEMRVAFETSENGFPLERLADRDLFDAIICDPRVLASHLNEIVINKSNEDYGIAKYLARFVDELGAEPFNPDEQATIKVDYLIHPLLANASVNLLVAKPEAMKTWLAYAMAIAVSKGLPFLGRFPARLGRAVIIAFEMGSDVKRRLKIQGADGRVLVITQPKHDLTSEQLWVELAKLRPAHGRWLIVVDGLNSGQRKGDFSELDSRFAGPLGRAAIFAERYGATFLFIHHSPKSATLTDVESLSSGTSAIRRWVSAELYVRRMPNGPNGERRSEVIPVKTQSGLPPDKFTVQLTDERGLELFEDAALPALTESLESPTASVTDAEKVYLLVCEEPGSSGNHIAKTLEMRRETVGEHLGELERAGRVRADVGGKGRPTAYFTTASEGVPASVPTTVPEHLGKQLP